MRALGWISLCLCVHATFQAEINKTEIEDDGSATTILAIQETTSTPQEDESQTDMPETNPEEEKIVEDLEEVVISTVPTTELNDSSETENTSDVTAENDIVEIKTYLGAVYGKISQQESGQKMYKFLGIPYASPPIGKLRFKPPQPVMIYKDLEAFSFGAKCPQFDSFGGNSEKLSGSEDCLFLNIFTTSIPQNNVHFTPKAVMLWIHGGGFNLGSADIYDPTPLVNEDVVVVTINYRLGGLGFLTFGNDIVAGNMGIRDQIAAMHWTKKFIHHFGGDPTKITIFGESAGATSVNALQMSPKAAGLFSGAIFQSGTMFLWRENYDKSRRERIASSIAEQFNCSSTRNDQKMLDCFQKLSFEDFLNTIKIEVLNEEKENKSFERGAWTPVCDSYSSDPVLPVEPLEAFTDGLFTRVPIMTGTVKNDGLVMIPKANFESFWKVVGPTAIGVAASSNKSETTPDEYTLANIILRFYNGGRFSLLESLNEVADMLTDALFLSPDQKLAELASKHIPVYNYQFTYSGSKSVLPFYVAASSNNFGDETQEAFEKLKPVHSDENIYLFNLFGPRNEEEEEVSKTLSLYWTNFAKYGHPSPFLKQNLTQWKHYATEKRYMELGVKAEMKSDIANERMTFWQKIYWNEKQQELKSSSVYIKLVNYVHSFMPFH